MPRPGAASPSSIFPFLPYISIHLFIGGKKLHNLRAFTGMEEWESRAPCAALGPVTRKRTTQRQKRKRGHQTRMLLATCLSMNNDSKHTMRRRNWEGGQTGASVPRTTHGGCAGRGPPRQKTQNKLMISSHFSLLWGGSDAREGGGAHRQGGPSERQIARICRRKTRGTSACSCWSGPP